VAAIEPPPPDESMRAEKRDAVVGSPGPGQWLLFLLVAAWLAGVPLLVAALASAWFGAPPEILVQLELAAPVEPALPAWLLGLLATGLSLGLQLALALLSQSALGPRVRAHHRSAGGRHRSLSGAERPGRVAGSGPGVDLAGPVADDGGRAAPGSDPALSTARSGLAGVAPAPRRLPLSRPCPMPWAKRYCSVGLPWPGSGGPVSAAQGRLSPA